MIPALRPALITTPRLLLEPLGVQHAAEMADVLAGTALYRYIGGAAPTAEELARRYAAQTVGGSPDRREIWLNWIIRDNGAACGFVQATVSQETDGPTSYVAWVVGEAFQGRGTATAAARAMLGWLRIHTPGPVAAFIHPENRASAAVARKLGLAATGLIDEDGEERWDDGAMRTH
ncbi:GNAT family N-acetyltransferase [Arthrobacter sunyaminii]|uniref:GNAT family N-acetyltransferase n=1 Tax=Arthrobacter sunyaminii TaxID=2816859 RepID=UPI001A93D5B5|nr:GNAT family N-acetyltransferase [Arthrobacter sunyaminii]MBO0895128.1 GNAT family N-acetyltransferase [Arthrobacter sunyaminii]